MSFYDEVLRELLAAVGAAMFFGNLYALFRRRADARELAARAPSRGRRASARGPVPKGRPANRSRGEPGDLPQAPVARTLVYVVLGFVMMVA
ncbi:MAG TPA: hypothetical protein VFW74_10995, partial [Acidimicrobiia bacterium]|nr:hypothetical protein [Acidimicrobiia bacterium]